MDPQNLQPVQLPDMPTSPPIDTPSPDIVMPELPKSAKPKHRVSMFKKFIISIIVVFAIACFALYWFAVPQNITISEKIGSKTDSDILKIVKKDYPSVESLHVTKKTPQYNERCIIKIPYMIYFGCNDSEVVSYDYEGGFTPDGAQFSMPFKVSVSNNEISIFLNDYEGVVTGDFLGNTKMSDKKWKSFVTFYNNLGYETLFSLKNFDLFDREIDGEDSTIAGYEYKNLYTICDKEPAPVKDDNGYMLSAGRCVVHSGSPYIPVKQSIKNGIYVIYYNEARNEWSALTDDGKYFTTWVWHQLETLGSYIDINKLKNIDWEASPIKVYK